MNYLILDVESTGLNPNVHSLIQIAARLYNSNGGIICEFNKKCSSNSLVDMGALKVNSQSLAAIRSTGNVSGGERLESELQLVSTFLDFLLENKDKLKNSMVIGHGIGFDISFIKAAAIRAGIELNMEAIEITWPITAHVDLGQGFVNNAFI